ncbi:MAG TPA: hypothetical protein VM943_12410 [Pyrinomonadaceae bacterium]|nr:hypothetical protein [Pyrinomonadaceae bacterium]
MRVESLPGKYSRVRHEAGRGFVLHADAGRRLITQLRDMIYEISTGAVNIFVAKPWTEQDMRQMSDRVGAF